VQSKNNERGSALMVVLFLVVVITILGVGLLTMNTSAAKQLNMKEEKVQARHQAEMGVLHYKAEVRDMLNKYNEKLKEIESEVTNQEELVGRLNIQKNKLCMALASKTLTGEDYAVTLDLGNTIGVDQVGCTNGEVDKVIQLAVNSSGKDGKAKIDATIFIAMPDDEFIVIPREIDGGGKGILPTPPNQDVKIVNGTFHLQNGPYPIDEGSLYVKGVNSKVTVEPGNNEGGTSLTLLKDLFIEGELNFHNQGCIIAHNDLTVEKKIYLGNKAYVFVYGDANLPKSIEMHNNNAALYVSGDVYIDGVLQVPKPSKYKNVPIGKAHGCNLSGPAESENNSESTPVDLIIMEWDLEERIEAAYVK